MANFSVYYPILLRNEGGYCNNPTDRGKETYCGISRVYNPQWGSWPTIDKIRLQHYPDTSERHPVPVADWLPLTRLLKADAVLSAHVASFYKAEYWDKLGLDLVASVSIANQLADVGVNCGEIRAANMAQYILNTTFGAHLAAVADNKIDSRSLAAALNTVHARAFYAEFIAMRRAYYHFLAGTTFPPAEVQALAAWHQFFRHELHVAPDAGRNAPYLASWLSRTHEPFVA